jgi:hypothetical protein
MEKIRYETDPFNRLVIASKKTGLRRNRRAVEGVFKIGKNNLLTYHTRTPLADGAGAPYQVSLDGKWSLTKDHDLKFSVDASKKIPASGSLTLSGEIVEAKGDSILFAMTTRTSDETDRTYLLELSGKWHADEQNRLAFSITRGAGRSDTLAFDAAWSTNGDNELIYRYERLRAGRRGRSSHTIIFRGHWHITGPAVASYSFEAGSRASFDFRTALGACEGDRIVFEIGIGLSQRVRPALRTVVLYGTWKISRSTGLIFETEYGPGSIYAMTFGAEARLSARDSVVFKLKDPAGRKSLGMEVTLSRELLMGDGSALLRILASKEESAVLIGGAFRW